jgi:hypothetical protein
VSCDRARTRSSRSGHWPPGPEDERAELHVLKSWTTAEMVGLSMTDEATTSGTEQAAGHPRLPSLAGDGDVRARRRHIPERVHRVGGPGSRHDRQRRSVGDRTRGAGVGRVHPDRRQGRRPHRPQAGLCVGPTRLRSRRTGHGIRPEPDAIMLATLSISFTALAESSTVPRRRPAAGGAAPGGRRTGNGQHAARTAG